MTRSGVGCGAVRGVAMMCRPAVHHLLLALMAGTAGLHPCGGWMQGSSQNLPPPPCPSACNCSLSPFPFSAKPLFTLQCREVEGVTWSVVTCNATQALLLSGGRVVNESSLPPFPHLHLLDLSSNSVTCSHCPQLFQHTGALVHLNLSGNAIRTLKNETFSALGDLEVLDLSFNKLSVLEPRAFKGLRQVSVLHLEHNQLYGVEQAWLKAMPGLRELYLQGNHISDIDGFTFTHTPSLLHLDLSSNALRIVSDNGFQGLQRLKLLNMSYNDLLTIPSQELQRLSSLAILLLDGISVPVLQPGDFSQLNVSSISLSYLPQLYMVRQGAFSNLTQLRTLQLHDNYQLMFIHPRAFDHVPLLHRLALHNNELVTLSSEVRDSLPSLDELHLYHNPLHCDCNIFWLRQDMMAVDDSPDGRVDTYLQHWDKLMCSSPDTRTQKDLKHVALHLLAPSCAPTSLPFFSDTYHVTVGDEIYLQCQVMGVPHPSLSWNLPEGRVLNSSTDSRHLLSLDNTVLTIPGVRLQDQGSYSCQAENALGADTSSTVVYVHNKDLKLSVITSSSTTATVSWTGSVPQQQMWQYHLRYWQQNGAENVTTTTTTTTTSSHRMDLSNDMQNCTLTGLQPLTSYRVCLVFREVFTVHCLNVSTGQQRAVLALPSGSLGTVSSSAISVCVVLLFAVLLYAVRVLRRWRGRLEKSDRDSLADGKEMEKILLEPIDQRVPDSPQCTPRTSLLPKSYV